MKRFLLKISITAIVVFLSVLLCAPALLHADPVVVSVTVTPEIGEIYALGQTVQYTAIARYDDESEVDVTATATWDIDDPAIATNDGGGLFTATASGNTGIPATFEGVTGNAILSVFEPDMWVFAGQPGETTDFGLWASGCSGLSWALNVTGPTSYSNSGTISSDPWDPHFTATLSGGDYTAVFSVGGVVQVTKTFSVYGYESSLDVAVGYAGETTTFTLTATNSSGKTADFDIYKDTGPGTWEMVYNENNISIGNDDWSYVITQTLAEGHYAVNYWVDNYANWGGGCDLYVVNRGVPQPPVVDVVEKAATVKKAAAVRRGPAINEKPLSSYGKTASGFSTLFYNRLLHRNPEKEGLDAWIARLESGEITGSDLIQQFIFGEECQKIISGYSNEEFIKYLYKALFNRTPGADGLNAWLARMSAGMTKEEVVKQFGLSEEFVILCNFFGIKPYPGYTENTN